LWIYVTPSIVSTLAACGFFPQEARINARQKIKMSTIFFMIFSPYLLTEKLFITRRVGCQKIVGQGKHLYFRDRVKA
jgi:hypothetical protein